LGIAADALADANEALKLTPTSSDSLHCRAYAHFGAGEFEKAIADYSRSISLGATDAKVLQLRGMAKFYAGRLVEAAEDFTKASDTGDKESQTHADLWLMWTYQRLDKPLPDALRERATMDAHGDWPRPVLAVLMGRLAPEEVLKLIERKNGDERRFTTSEGYFYLGQYYRGHGDKIKAGEFFEKTRRLNLMNRIEYKAAGFELQYLGPPPERFSLEASAAQGKPTGSLPAASATTGDRPPATVPGPASAPPKANTTSQKVPRKAPQTWIWKLW
jgi:lipoprotein NlpI